MEGVKRMTYSGRNWMIVLLLLTGQIRCQAQQSPDANSVMDKGARGTAYIMGATNFYKPNELLAQQVSGSAFCVSNQGYYITNAHVIARMRTGTPFDIYLWTNSQNLWNGDAVVVRTDKTLDLALIKVKTPPPVYPLTLGPDTGAPLGTPVTAFGFPGLMQHSSFSMSRPPGLLVSTGHITRLATAAC